MCLGNSPNGLAACSTFGKKVFIIDTKNGLAPVLNYAHHKGAVLTLAMQDNIVYSCGEDRRIVMVDIRNSSKPVSGLASKIDGLRGSISPSGTATIDGNFHLRHCAEALCIKV
ncbi:hypothetical protein OSTOST_08912 [Ostertagia ostertagi]